MKGLGFATLRALALKNLQAGGVKKSLEAVFALL
jgi:hypothetical protein